MPEPPMEWLLTLVCSSDAGVIHTSIPSYFGAHQFLQPQLLHPVTDKTSSNQSGAAP